MQEYELENRFLSAVFRSPETIYPVLLDPPIKIASGSGNYILECMIDEFKRTSRVTSVSLWDSVDRIKVEKNRKEVIDRISTILNMEAPAQPLEVAEYILGKLHDIEIRGAATICVDEIKTGLQEESPVSDLLLNIDKLYSTLAGHLGSAKSNPLVNIIDEVLGTGEPIVHTGIKCGYAALDEALHGFRPGLFVIMGDAKDGKSTFALNIIYNIVKAGYKVLIMSIEMQQQEWLMKTLSLASGTPYDALVDGTWAKNAHDKAAVTSAANEMRTWEKRYFFEMVPGSLSDALRFHIVNYVCREHVDMVVYDYLRVRSDDDNTYQLFGNMTAMFHNLSLRLKIPIVCLAQTRRPAGRRGAVLSKFDIADSYHPIRDAAAVLGVQTMSEGLKHSNDPKTPNYIVNIVASRFGQDDIQNDIIWNRPRMSMKDATRAVKKN